MELAGIATFLGGGGGETASGCVKRMWTAQVSIEGLGDVRRRQAMVDEEDYRGCLCW
jgi:hypothetical protein